MLPPQVVILVCDDFIPFFVFLILLFDISLTLPIPLPIIAFLFSGLVFGLEGRVKEHFEMSGPCRTAVFYCMAMVSFLASLNYGRGLWSLMDFYFFPAMDPALSLLLSHLLGFTWTAVAGTALTLTQETVPALT